MWLWNWKVQKWLLFFAEFQIKVSRLKASNGILDVCVQHARVSKECPFLLKTMSSDFIDYVNSPTVICSNVSMCSKICSVILPEGHEWPIASITSSIMRRDLTISNTPLSKDMEMAERDPNWVNSLVIQGPGVRELQRYTESPRTPTLLKFYQSHALIGSTHTSANITFLQK